MMKLVGPWFSGPTRRVGITLKLLDIPFEHLALHAYLQRDEVRAYSPMGKVPALVLDDGKTLYDSRSIVEYLHELVGPEHALLAPAGPLRHEALHYIGIADAVYTKFFNVYDESLRPAEFRMAELADGWIQQGLTGLTMLEERAGDGWMVGGALSQADVFVVVSYQGAASALPERVNRDAYPRLAALAERAMRLPAFADTIAVNSAYE
jgi:glutathione S-transferase